MPEDVGEISVVVSLDSEHKVYMTEEDLKTAWEYATNFERFLRLLRFLASMGGQE